MSCGTSESVSQFGTPRRSIGAACRYCARTDAAPKIRKTIKTAIRTVWNSRVMLITMKNRSTKDVNLPTVIRDSVCHRVKQNIDHPRIRHRFGKETKIFRVLRLALPTVAVIRVVTEQNHPAAFVLLD